MIPLSKKYQRIYNKLTNLELQLDNSFSVSVNDQDIVNELADKKRPHLFLDFYSEEGIYKALEKYGIFDDLRKRGFDNFIIIIDTHDSFRHKLRIYYNSKSADNLLCEAYVRKKTFLATPIFQTQISGEQYSLIEIEWLMLQDPTAQFTFHRPQLPGQKFPGLRIGRKVLTIFHNMAIRLRADGLLNVPEHYHNAFFYGRIFKYFNPQTEGYFRAIQRDLKKIRLNKAAWGIEWNCLVDECTGQHWKWFADEQIFPVSNRMIQYFKSSEYCKKVKEAFSQVKFYIDEEKFNIQKSKYMKGDAKSAYFGD